MRKEYWYGIVVFLIIIICALALAKPINAAEKQPELKLIEATAYYDSYHNGKGADGRPLVEDLTIAGRPEDLGKTAILYDMNYKLIGIYEFRDTGYGQSSGYGKSRVLPGRTIGTIENGSCVDVYFSSYMKCLQWGRRKVYIQIIDAKG